MVPVHGKPFLEYELLLLKSRGISDFVLCVGHLGEQIVDYFGDGKKHDVRIQYSYDGQNLLGPAGALKKAGSILNDSFFVTYGDAYLRLDYQKVMAEFMNSDKLALMVVYENRNKYGRSDVIVKDGYVVSYNKRELGGNEGMAWINFGVSALRKHALEAIAENKTCGEEEFYGKLIQRRQLLAYPTMERFYEIGNPNSLREFEGFISTEKSLLS